MQFLHTKNLCKERNLNQFLYHESTLNLNKEPKKYINETEK